MLKIQRVPQGLQNLLALQGADTPIQLDDKIAGVIDLLQMYGLQQRQGASASNAAAAEGAAVIVTPSARDWVVLFGAHGNFTKTATQTALRGEVFLNRTAGSSILLAGEDLGPFGATETGSAAVGGYLPYPLLLPPNSFVFAQASVIGTDATAAVSCVVEFGVIG